MNWLDIVILIMIVISAVSGFASGLIKSVFSLAGLIVGIVLAGRYYVGFSNQLGFIPGDSGPRIAAFIIIFLAVMLVATLLGIILTKIISAIMLGWLNRIGGAVLGIVLGAFFAASLLAIWVQVGSPGDFMNDSKLAPILLDKLPFILGLLPPEFNNVQQFFQ
jgi:membrane protein required for colicin V production